MLREPPCKFWALSDHFCGSYSMWKPKMWKQSDTLPNFCPTAETNSGTTGGHNYPLSMASMASIWMLPQKPALTYNSMILLHRNFHIHRNFSVTNNFQNQNYYWKLKKNMIGMISPLLGGDWVALGPSD